MEPLSQQILLKGYEPVLISIVIYYDAHIIKDDFVYDGYSLFVQGN